MAAIVPMATMSSPIIQAVEGARDYGEKVPIW